MIIQTSFFIRRITEIHDVYTEEDRVGLLRSVNSCCKLNDLETQLWSVQTNWVLIASVIQLVGSKVRSSILREDCEILHAQQGSGNLRT